MSRYLPHDEWLASSREGRVAKSSSVRIEILRDPCPCDVCGRPIRAGVEVAVHRAYTLSRFLHTACAGMGQR